LYEVELPGYSSDSNISSPKFGSVLSNKVIGTPPALNPD
jgi:hypothetical protein